MRNKLVAWVSAFCLIQSCFADITVSARSDIDMAFDNMLDERDLELPVGDMKDLSGIEKIYGDEPDVYCEDLCVASELYGFYKYGSDYGRMCFAEESPELLGCYDDLLEQCRMFERYYSDIEASIVNGIPMYFLPKLINKDYTYNLSLDDIRTVIITLIKDHPELYWLESFVYSYNLSESPYIVSLTINEDYASGNRRKKLDEQIERNLERYISLAEHFRSQGDYITVKAIHDEIINSVDYAYEYTIIDGDVYRRPSIVASAHNIVAVLDDNDESMPVCEGYTEAFQLILNALGIDNIYVTGKGLTEFGEEPHAWSLVMLDDGNYYFIDVTWNDQGQNGIVYRYFAKGKDGFLDHVINFRDDNADDYMIRLPDIPKNDFGIISYIDKRLTDGVKTVDSGVCGENMRWTLYDNGLLYINGTGEMYDFEFDYQNQTSKAPWCKHSSDINFVLTDNSIINISSFAFWKCTGIIAVYISDGLESIGSYVFGNCINLNSARLPASLNNLKTDAFRYCSSISDIYYGGNEEQWQMIDKSNAYIPEAVMHYNFTDPSSSDGYQYTINDLKITDGKAEIELAAEYNAGPAYIILAAYNDDAFKFLLKKEAGSGKILFDDARIVGSLNYKAVVWDSLSGQKPLAKSK